MIIVSDLKKIPPLSQPIALTMGNFDGMHLGHQRLLQHARRRVGPTGSLALLTFSNHPATVLTAQTPMPLFTLEEKIEQFEKAGVDLLILLTFTPELAMKPFDVFLHDIKETLPFSMLILGKGATFGHGKKGDEVAVKAIQKELGFTAEYLEKEKMDGRVISSGWIREEKQKNNKAVVEKLLGRKS